MSPPVADVKIARKESRKKVNYVKPRNRFQAPRPFFSRSEEDDVIDADPLIHPEPAPAKKPKSKKAKKLKK